MRTGIAPVEATVAHRVLVIDGEFAVAGLARYALSQNSGVEVDVVRTAKAALDWLREAPPDLVVLDVALLTRRGSICAVVYGRLLTAATSLSS